MATQEQALRVGVIGAGVMGHGIAQSMATAGYPTICFDISEEALSKAHESVRSGRFGVERGVARGKTTREDADAALARLEFSSDVDHAASAGLIIECVPEQLALKMSVLRDLDARAPAESVLATNTSGFPIAGLAGATERPERVVGWHWASPPVVMKFAEIIEGPQTAPETTQVVVEAARACGKNPVVIKDNPMHWGFVANRVYAAMLREASTVVSEEVATQEEVNQLMVDCFGWPVGPFAMVKGAGSGWD